MALEAPMPNESSEFAREGTCAHTVAALCLTEKTQAAAYIGRIFEVEGQQIEVTEDMAGHVQCYVDVVLQYAEGHELMVEQRVPIGHITGEQGAEGTSDAIVITADGDEIIVIDLKFGRGVQVSAEENEQGQLYALGALEFVALLGYEPKRVRVVIHQPRVSVAPSEWDCPTADLLRFADYAKERATTCHTAMTYQGNWGELHDKYLTPAEKQCRFCKAKATCPALVQHVLTTVADDFVDISKPILPQIAHRIDAAFDNATLGNLLDSVDLIEDWCKAIRAKVEAELFAGRDVPGYKLIEGRRGARGWGSEAEAEAAMKSMRLKQDEMYTFKLISPTAAEKLLAKDNPRRWSKLQALVTQNDGKPSVAPASDKRPALNITPTVDDFADITETVEDLV